MATYILYYSVRYITEPTRVKTKEFDSLARAQRYYNACREDWYGKALSEYEKTINNENYRPRFEDYFRENVNPERDVLCEFGGELGWKTYSFSLERL